VCCVFFIVVSPDDNSERWTSSLQFPDEGRGVKHQHEEESMHVSLRRCSWAYYNLTNEHKDYLFAQSEKARKTKKGQPKLVLNLWCIEIKKEYKCDQSGETLDLSTGLIPNHSLKFTTAIRWKGYHYRCAEKEDKRKKHKSFNSYFRMWRSFIDESTKQDHIECWLYGRIQYFIQIEIANTFLNMACVVIYTNHAQCRYSNEPIIDINKPLSSVKYIDLNQIDAPIILAKTRSSDNSNSLYYALLAKADSLDF
jgi:hypothetical protein